jgi:hypothetical protein
MKGNEMKTLGRIGLFAAAAALIAAAAQAQSPSPKLQQLMASEAAKLAKHAEDTSKECGSPITATFDWSGLQEDALGNQSAHLWCEAALEGIEHVCGDAPGKNAVKEKIQSVTCSFGPERGISLKDGAVDFKINFKSSNDAAFVFEALENAL